MRSHAYQHPTLTPDQLGMIRRVADALDPAFRYAFELRVADKLKLNKRTSHVTNDLVTEVVNHVLQQLGYRP